MTNVHTLENINKMHTFSLMDLADPTLLMKDIDQMKISKSRINVIPSSEAELKPEFNLFLGRIKAIHGEKGVGGLWFLSREIAEEAWDNFYGVFKYHLSVNEWYSVFHSAGGGTGCGAGPAFMENIYEQTKRDLSEDLYTATLVLPSEHWEAWREVNSATAIGRYLGIAHGIFVADNLQGEALVKRAVSGNEFIETEDPRELINRRLAQVWISMQMANMKENEPIPNVYDAANYRNLFSNSDCAGILVPCFHEYTLTQFARREINLTGAINDTMKNHQLAQFELGSSENMIIIVTFPSMTTGTARYTIKDMEDCGYIVDSLRKMYGENFGLTVICTYSESLVDTIKVTALAKDPYIPRFVDIYEKLETIVADPNEMTKTINRMFPRRFDRARKRLIMVSAKEEFRRAHSIFSQYMDFCRYDNHERKMPSQVSRPVTEKQEALRNGNELELFEFDISISFAGENREIAEELAKKLQDKGVRVFYDKFHKTRLWGRKLTTYFQDVYGPKTRFVVPLISRYYPIKDWTDFEFSIMRAEAKNRQDEFILPIKLDNTEILGIHSDIGYLDYSEEGIDDIVGCLLEKLSS